MTGTGRFQRYEMKYRLPLGVRETISRYIAPFTERDPYCEKTNGRIYTVRSAYFDTEDFRFYFERQDGLKVRRKLRVRLYNRGGEACPVFLEIKRKFNRTVFKERIPTLRNCIENVLDGNQPDPERHLLVKTLTARQTLGRFRYTITAGDMRPVVLVVYEREAFVGKEDPRLRVTFDTNLRSQMYPSMEGLSREDDLRGFLDGHFVLELKFDLTMPGWMRSMVHELGLRAAAYSKYCTGIDAWVDPVGME